MTQWSSRGLKVSCVALLQPCTGLSLSIYCTLTNKAVGTIWRALSEPPQKRQGLIFVPSDCYTGLLKPSDLSSFPDGLSTAYPIRMSLDIFLICNIYYLCCLCIHFYDLSAWCGCWFVVYIKKVYLQIFKCVSFWLNDYCGELGRWVRKLVNHTSRVAVVTPTDRPKSVRNRCVIELFVVFFVLSLCPFDISVRVGAFAMRLSQISSFLSLPWLKFEIRSPETWQV